MHIGVKQLLIFLVLVLIVFGGPIGAFIRGIRRRSAPPPPPRPSRPSRPSCPSGRKVRASEDIVDAEIVNERRH